MFTIRGLSCSALARLAANRPPSLDRPLCVLLCIADHFEPRRENPSPSVARERVARWVNEYPRLAGQFADCRGRPPQHTFFYPAEEYEPEHLDRLAELCHAGWGEVEVHLHHDRDTADGLREQLTRFTAALHDRHGLLQRDPSGRITYGFIHGNWALDNSRPDGRWCGVNDEITVLLETGCYADFTMPSAPAGCQTTTINSIYYAIDDPARPKSHDTGTPARAKSPPPDDSLLLIQGPLALDWRARKWGLLPKIENGDLTGLRPPTIDRLHDWLGARVHVRGHANWRFVKLHTHGAWEPNTQMLLGEPMQAFHRGLQRLAAEQDGFRYYYVTAREMAQLVHALESAAPPASPEAVLSPAGTSPPAAQASQSSKMRSTAEA
ncbi:MAG: hypothetical protein WD872_21865 [Pirellulaceae bacterium]